ncbi:MAG TPA: ABC transporter substrate-binding protein [Actinopolymorphaceae bacterium]
MSDRRGFGRRALLRAGAAGAGAAMLGACTGGASSDDRRPPANDGRPTARGSHAKPLTKPRRLAEAPSLAAKVEAGDLEPVTERLPADAYVVPHKWLEPGRYGGTLRLETPDTGHPSNREYMYGHSLLRWLNDCLDIGPGLAERWESNDDASEWTFYFRKGLRWSDGAPWTTADILFWWEDLVLDDRHPAGAPDELRSGKGTLAKVTAPDDHTLVLTFDAPAPLTADRVANWVNGGVGANGPIWMLPKHYLAKYHPRYNEKAPKDWAAAGGAFDVRSDFAKNPDCPTMTGWRLTSYREGHGTTWERNPYYWCVDRQGNQLPYIDRLEMTAVSELDVAKLHMQEGRVDYVHGPFMGIELTDVAAFQDAESRSGLRVLLWDSGAGGGATAMLNQDYQDEKIRALFRDKRFRRALSYAFDREAVRKTVYFGTGEKTTGTLSPKAVEYHVRPEGPALYERWRDSYVDHDPDEARRILDEIGVVDVDGDGKRELPDGSKLTLRLDHPTDTTPSRKQTCQLLARDWKAIGLETILNPVSPEAYPTRWSAGELMTNTTWELGDGPNHLVFPNFLVPIDPDRWAPLQGRFYAVRGTSAESSQRDVDPWKRTPPRLEPEPGGPIERLWQLYDRTKVEPDEMKRHRLVWEMIKIHIDEGPFMHGSVANYPKVILAHRDLRNVPDKKNLAQGGFVNPWIHPTPAAYDPETYFWQNPSKHA